MAPKKLTVKQEVARKRGKRRLSSDARILLEIKKLQAEVLGTKYVARRA